MVTVSEVYDEQIPQEVMVDNKAHLAFHERQTDDGKWQYDCVWLPCDVNDKEASLLASAREKCLADVNEYGNSSEGTDKFYLNGKQKWIDFDLRSRVRIGNENLRLVGRDMTTLWLGSDCYTMTIDQCQLLIAQIDAYGKDCYNVTAQKMEEVRNLTTLQELVEYDVTAGYPEPISLTVDEDNKIS